MILSKILADPSKFLVKFRAARNLCSPLKILNMNTYFAYRQNLDVFCFDFSVHKTYRFCDKPTPSILIYIIPLISLNFSHL